MSITRKCHTHILQTNQWHREEESKTDKRDPTPKNTTSKNSQLSLFQREIIVKLERTQSTAKQNKDRPLNPHKQWEQHQPINKQQQNRQKPKPRVGGGLKFI